MSPYNGSWSGGEELSHGSGGRAREQPDGGQRPVDDHSEDKDYHQRYLKQIILGLNLFFHLKIKNKKIEKTEER